jgi:hypothetical protein
MDGDWLPVYRPNLITIRHGGHAEAIQGPAYRTRCFQAATSSSTRGDGKIFAFCLERRQELHPVLHRCGMDNSVFRFASQTLDEMSVQ